MNAELITAAELKNGQSGRVVSVQGGQGMRARLESMGVREGIMIEKTSAQFMRGPVVLKAGQVQLALGFGMARKILIRLSGADK